MNKGKEVYIKAVNLDKLSYVEKRVNCDICYKNNECTDMTACPIIGHIARDVTRTSYDIRGAKLRIDTATYGHDFRRAIDVVNMAIDACCHQR